MNLNFGYAKKTEGSTILRFDDTNPEAEKKEYFDNIIENVSWMGYKPVKVTYSSDYFPELYKLAIQLIKSGKAYVDHLSPADHKKYRFNLKVIYVNLIFREERKEGKGTGESPYRNRPIEESLREFENMKNGKYEEGGATLRMKMDMKSDNPCMWDLVAYRIKYTPHPHAGDKWCIYPSYDYTHCIIDSLENISHSLCTLEFGVTINFIMKFIINSLESSGILLLVA